MNRSECVPFAFRVYAKYEVTSRLQDKQLHALIDRLNPSLRAIDSFDGKERVKEFYAMSPEEAYALLECIAMISGTKKRLHRMKPEGHEVLDERIAEEIKNEARERKSPFSFTKCGIPAGEQVVFTGDSNIVATVVDDRRIEFRGTTYSLSGLTAELMHVKAIQGPKYWTYRGRALTDIRIEREKSGMYVDDN